MLSKAVKVLIGAALLLLISLNANSLYEKALFYHVGQSVLLLSSASGSGTGFQVKAPSGKKYILTNMHVCDQESVLDSEDLDGNKQKVAVLEVYKNHDLCLVQGIPELPALRIGKEIEAQQEVYTVGHPQAMNTVLERGRFLGNTTIQVGYRCTDEQRKQCFDRNMGPKLQEECLIRLLFNICPKEYEVNYTNNSIAPGSSGSPVVDKLGRVVGVVFAGSSRYDHAAFSVPLYYVEKFLKDK